MDDDTYICAVCGERFEKGWTDEEAAAETAELFGAEAAAADDLEIVCDDCFQKMNAWMDPHKWQEQQKQLSI